MDNPEHTSNYGSRRQDPMHPHGVAGTPGNPGRAKGGERRLNETAPAGTTPTEAAAKPSSTTASQEGREAKAPSSGADRPPRDQR